MRGGGSTKYFICHTNPCNIAGWNRVPAPAKKSVEARGFSLFSSAVRRAGNAVSLLNNKIAVLKYLDFDSH